MKMSEEWMCIFPELFFNNRIQISHIQQLEEQEEEGEGELTTNANRSRELGCYAACVWNNVEV